MDNDDQDERPTLPSLRTKQRPKVRLRRPDSEQARFDAMAEHFFSNVETQPELVIDADLRAKLAAARASAAPADDEVSAWWAEQRRSTSVRFVALLLAACVALLFAGALR